MADDETAMQDSPQGRDLSPGATLRQAREAQKTSIQEAADEMHLDRWMLEALERNDFAALGAPVFAKGHLRQYAKVLGIEPDDLMVAYYQVCGSREQPPLLAESTLRAEGQTEQSLSWLWPVLLTVAVIAAVGLAIYLWMQPTEEPASTSSEGSRFELPATREEVVAEVTTLVPEELAEPVANDATRDLLIPASAVPESAAADAAGSVAGSIVSNNLMVTLRFNEESWVEVYDSKRQKLLYGLVDSAAVKYLSGPPPLSVFLGRQNAVSVEVNGSPYAIPEQALKGNTARFQIDAPQ